MPLMKTPATVPSIEMKKRLSIVCFCISDKDISFRDFQQIYCPKIQMKNGNAISENPIAPSEARSLNQQGTRRGLHGLRP